MVYYNPLDKFYKSQIGAVEEGALITFRVKGDFNQVSFMCKKDGEDFFVKHKMNKVNDCFQLEISFNVGLYFYYFDLENGNYIGVNDGVEGVLTATPVSFQLTAYKKEYYVPEWAYGGVIYQIFPDRFFRGDKDKNVPDYKVLHDNWNELPVFLPNEKGEIVNNDFFGGDLNGIIEKLDYVKSLGANIIYLNPIFKAFSNHRYDTGDYMQIDPMLGTMADFQNLIKKANENGIKIVLDGVFNHTGDDSRYFNRYNRYDSVGAYQSKESPYYKWFNFINFPNKYDSWWGIKTLPATNENNKDYIDFITGENGVLDYYTKLGIGGWRLDVVDELPSDFVKSIRRAVKSVNNDAIVIGEVWEDASNKISYGKRREYLQGKELDSAMNYPLKNAILNFVKYGDAKNLSKVIKEQIDHYPHKALHAMMNILSTHDTARLLTVVDSKYPISHDKKVCSQYKIPNEEIESAKFRVKVATLLQFTLCGVPSVYYGDEIGMQGYADPLNRCTYPWGQEDAEILNWYKFLSKLRSEYSAFSQGEFEEIFKDNGIYIYKRFDNESQVLLCVNMSDKMLDLVYNGNMLNLVDNENHCNKIVLNPNSVAVLINVD